MQLHKGFLSIVVLGTALLVLAIIILTSESKQRKGVEEINCVVANITVGYCSGATPASPTPCATYTLSANVCGNNATVTTALPASTYKQAIQMHPLGSFIECWRDSDSCSLYADYDKPSYFLGIAVLLSAPVFMLIGGCCYTQQKGRSSTFNEFGSSLFFLIFKINLQRNTKKRNYFFFKEK